MPKKPMMMRVIRVDNCEECPSLYFDEEGIHWCWLREDDGPAHMAVCPLLKTDVVLTKHIWTTTRGN